jgi:hypothetical protein
MREGYRLFNSRLVGVPELVHRPLRSWAADKTFRVGIGFRHALENTRPN